MCNIWKTEIHEEISPCHYAKLPRSLRTVNITGGEPFLRNDLTDIVKTIHNRIPRSRLVFSTNGLLTEKITRTMSDIMSVHKNTGVGVSIDGIGKTHDRIRGTDGGFQRALSTVENLKRIGLEDLRLAMTIGPENICEVGSVYGIAHDLGVEFTCTLAHNSDVYFHKADNPVIDFSRTENSEALRLVVRNQLKSKAVKDWFRAYHTAGMVDSDIRNSFKFRCEAGKRYFFMAPNGDIYPCNVMDRRIGNISNVEKWENLFTDQIRAEVSDSVKNCGLNCWMVCNTRSLILAHPFRTISWILKRKFSRTSVEKD